MNTVMMDKARIKRAFAAASATYDGFAQLQHAVSKELLRNAGIGQLNGTILDLGCGTGFLTTELINAQPAPDAVIALDLAWPMLQTTRRKLTITGSEGIRQKLIYLCADAERLPFAEHSVNGVFSNLALQWCLPIESTLAGIKRILKPGSPLVFSTFGPETLRELKNAWAKIDDYSHVNEFYSERQLQHFLNQAGFADPRISVKLHRPLYESVSTLMLELKKIGAHHVCNGRNKRITSKTRLKGMIAAYEQYREEDRIPASFEVIQVVARA